MRKEPAQPVSTGKGKVRFVVRYWHYRAKKWMDARDYGYRAWPFVKKG